MPTYVYTCTGCAYVVEKSHSILDTPTYHCDECDLDLVRKPTLAAVQFVGGGFYSKDK